MAEDKLLNQQLLVVAEYLLNLNHLVAVEYHLNPNLSEVQDKHLNLNHLVAVECLLNPSQLVQIESQVVHQHKIKQFKDRYGTTYWDDIAKTSAPVLRYHLYHLIEDDWLTYYLTRIALNIKQAEILRQR